MHKKETDILQIRKYLNGELDAKAMHQLERLAHSDPFLMDALEGYGTTGANQQANLDEISARLARRIANKGGRIIPWRYLAAAASILVVLTIGGLLLYNRQPENKRQVADMVKPVEKTDSVVAAKPEVEEKKEVAVSLAPPPPQEHRQKLSGGNNTYVAPVVVADEMAVSPNKNIQTDSTVQYKAVTGDFKPQKDISGNVASAAPEDVTKREDVSKQTDKAFQGRAAGVIVDNFSKTYLRKVPSGYVVTGRVIERDGGLPLSGATVMVSGTKIATVTNVDGYFSIPADSSKDKLYIANIGYQSRQVSARNRDSLATIKLKPDDKALAEVVVIGYGTSKKNNDDAIVVNGAHPATGWGSFNKYLKKNSISADGSSGVVKLSFEVASNGTVSNIIVVKGLSKAADQKAVDLIKNGPAWVGNTSGETEKVTVRIKFVKAK